MNLLISKNRRRVSIRKFLSIIENHQISSLWRDARCVVRRPERTPSLGTAPRFRFQIERIFASTCGPACQLTFRLRPRMLRRLNDAVRERINFLWTSDSETNLEIRNIGRIWRILRDSAHSYSCCLLMKTGGFILNNMCANGLFNQDTHFHAYKYIRAVIKTPIFLFLHWIWDI